MRHIIIALSIAFCSTLALAATPRYIPIFTYHNFEPSKKGLMTIGTHKFEAQLQWLKDNGYTVIPLKEAVDYLRGKIATIPAKSVVITMDDGRVTVYKYALPIVQKYHVPVTLFIYPSIISHQPYALTWGQLKTLQHTGLFTIEDHTLSHPNFKQEKKHQSGTHYENFVRKELATSKKILENKMGTNVTLLAWPFGIYNAQLEQAAAQAGYTMAFSIDYRCANKSDRAMAMPRYMVLENQSMGLFQTMAACRMQPKKHVL